MRSVLDQSTREELINRIKTLNESTSAQWGKMNVHQMIKHCILAEEMLSWAGKSTSVHSLASCLDKWL